MPSTTTVMSILAFGALCIATEVSAEDHEGHGHHTLEPCGCAAAEDGWKINCTDITPVEAAYNELIADDCSASEEACDADKHCQSNYRIVQAHHDHCSPNTLPTAMEQAFHDYEATCAEAGCIVGRQFAAGAAVCPTVDCEDQTAMTTAVAALDGCDADCSSSACTDAFKQVHAFHDSCEEKDLVDAIESGLHTYEDACAAGSACNTVSEAFDANECTEVHGDEHEEEEGHDEHEGHDDHDEHEGHDDHDNHLALEPCGCAAAEDGWKINCTDITPVEAAYKELIADGCSASDEACDADKHCQSNYRIVQAHHDHCSPNTLPIEIEQKFHGFEDACHKEHGCSVGRQFAAGATACPTVDCEDQTAMTAAVDALSGCETDCSSSACTDAFTIVHAFHDSCNEKDLVDAIETGLHAYEDACAKSACNTVTEAFDANECTEVHDDHDDHDDEKTTTKKSDTTDASSAVIKTVGVGIFAIVATVF